MFNVIALGRFGLTPPCPETRQADPVTVKLGGFGVKPKLCSRGSDRTETPRGLWTEESCDWWRNDWDRGTNRMTPAPTLSWCKQSSHIPGIPSRVENQHSYPRIVLFSFQYSLSKWEMIYCVPKDENVTAALCSLKQLIVIRRNTNPPRILLLGSGF